MDPFLLCRSTHPPHDGDGLGRKKPRVADLIVDDAVKHLLLIVTGEGRLKRDVWRRKKRTRNTVISRRGSELVMFEVLRGHALTSPTSISKMRTPSPHQSTARVYEVSVRTSGARNSGVPQNVLVRSLKPIPETNREAA